MASREHSVARASLPPADAEASAEGTSRAAVTSDGLDCPESSRPAGRPTPLAASLLEGGLAFTRRAVLGAAVAVPVAAGLSSDSARLSPPAASRRAHGEPLRPLPGEAARLPILPREAGEGKWSDALAAYREADSARAKFEVATSAASAGPGGRDFDEQEALDERFGEVVDAADEAMLALLEAPAPDLEALVEKISLIGDHLVWEMEGGEECLAWIEADARRLAGL